MKKKLIFLDGDGTLWYPKSTKRTEKPHWIYHDPKTKDNYLDHLELTPYTKQAIQTLHERGVLLVAVSAHPSSPDIAVKEIQDKLNHFGLLGYFSGFRASRGDDPAGKAAIMLETLDEMGLGKKDALMVGDSYFYDYKAAKDVGIDAYFIENSVARMPEVRPKDIESIKEVRDLVGLLN